MIALEVYLFGNRKRIICLIYLTPTDQVTEEDMRDLPEQHPVPIILLGDFNAFNSLWGREKNEYKKENDRENT